METVTHKEHPFVRLEYLLIELVFLLAKLQYVAKGAAKSQFPRSADEAGVALLADPQRGEVEVAATKL